MNWINVDEELPSCDGLYNVANNHKSEIGIAFYDGYGFNEVDIFQFFFYVRYEKLT